MEIKEKKMMNHKLKSHIEAKSISMAEAEASFPSIIIITNQNMVPILLQENYTICQITLTQPLS